MNVSLPDALREFVDEQVASGSYGTHSEYVRELIRRERDRLRLREALLQGAESPPASEADAAFFDRLRARAQRTTSASTSTHVAEAGRASAKRSKKTAKAPKTR